MPPTTAIVDDEHSAMNLEVARLNNRTIFSTNNLKRLQHVFQLRKLNEDNAANLRGLMAALFTDEDASALLDLFVDDGDQGSRVTVLAVFENLIKAGLKSITWEEILMHFSSNKKTRLKAFDFVKRMFGTVNTSDSVIKASIKSAMPSPTKTITKLSPRATSSSNTPPAPISPPSFFNNDVLTPAPAKVRMFDVIGKTFDLTPAPKEQQRLENEIEVETFVKNQPIMKKLSGYEDNTSYMYQNESSGEQVKHDNEDKKPHGNTLLVESQRETSEIFKHMRMVLEKPANFSMQQITLKLHKV